MKYVELTCPGCKKPYQAGVEDAVFNARCPHCTQVNTIKDPIAVNGLCHGCGLPLDHRHRWSGDRVIACEGEKS